MDTVALRIQVACFSLRLDVLISMFFFRFYLQSRPRTRRRKDEKLPFDYAATVQLAIPESCLVIHLARRSGKYSMACAPILKAVLCDEQFIKAGCALDEDLMSLYDLWGGLDAKSRLDLGFLGGPKRTNRFGLKTSSKGLLGVDLPKPKEIAVSDWSAVPLTEPQIVYSALETRGRALPLCRTWPSITPIRSATRYWSSRCQKWKPPSPSWYPGSDGETMTKRDLRLLLAPYQSKSTDVPDDIRAQIHYLRGLIKRRVIEPQLIFEVDHLANIEDK